MYSLQVLSKSIKIHKSHHSSEFVRLSSGAIPSSDRLSVPNLDDFPSFLKGIESKWRIKLARRHERERHIESTDIGGKLPRYILSMFPYPSGRLHLGHVRIYTSADLLARYSKLMANRKDSQDYEHVINPMGFDSFGLPAENAARERGLNPADWTSSNIRVMKQQLDDLALQFNWREATSNPNFYKWTQDIFLKLMDAGLVYKSFAFVNWDPLDKTVLADEQVDEHGRSWRSGATVEKRYFRQWFVKVSKFTSAIYDADDVDPETWRDVLKIQRNWVGRPNGWLFYLPIRNDASNHDNTLLIFTKRPELFTRKGTKLIISRDHWLEKVYKISDTGYIRNPFNGCEMKIVFTDDIDNLPRNCGAALYTDEITDDTTETMARDQILSLAAIHGFGGYYSSDNYRDWLVSRQRFWGTPIPVVKCQTCGYQGAPHSSLPVTLPPVKNFDLRSGTSNLEKNSEFEIVPPIQELAPLDWLETSCPSCHLKARKEGETLDTLFDSAWYFLRYASSPTADSPFDPSKVQPVWCYIGGIEHASMHLFYARFITHFLHSAGYIGFKEPFRRLLVQGVVKSRTFKLDGRYLSKSEADSLSDKKGLTVEYEKMSKSKGNGVDPQDLLNTYGIDATRFCLMSYANPRSERLWRTDREEFKDVLLFFRRVALSVQDYCDASRSVRTHLDGEKRVKIKELNEDELESWKSQIRQTRNTCAVDIIFNIEISNQFRQYISALHVLLTSIRSNLTNSLVYTRELAESLASLIVMLNPVVPHLSEELWSHFSRCEINPLKTDTSTPFRMPSLVCDQPWPVPDSDHKLLIKIRPTNSTRYIETLPFSRDEFNGLSNDSIAKLVEDHFSCSGNTCKVVEVEKFRGITAKVVADFGSIDTKMWEKRKRKEPTSIRTNE